MADYITLAEYKQYDTTTPSADDTLLGYVITAASGVIDLHTERTFTATDYDEVFDGCGYTYLLVENFPIISVSRVATSPTAVLTIQNTDAAVSRASVRVTSTGLTLTSIASGVTSTTTLPFASYPTLTALAAAVVLVSGWTATVGSGFSTWASADLRSQQGASDARRAANLVVHTQDIGDYIIEPEVGQIDYLCGFWRGIQNWRIQYRAGFETVPEAIKMVCKELVRATYAARKIDANLASETLGVWSWTRAAKQGLDNLSFASKATLNYYKAYRVGRFKPTGGLWY